MKHLKLKQGDYCLSLLSDEEFVRYSFLIPKIEDWWWLLPPTSDASKDDDDKRDVGTIKFINLEGDKNDLGWEPTYRIGVRPIIRFNNSTLKDGEVFSALGNRWISLDNGLAISLDTICHKRIDGSLAYWEKYYKTAGVKVCELKIWLEEWGKAGEENE